MCSIENGGEFQFIFDTTAITYTIKSKTGNSHSINGENSTSSYTKAGIVTSNGIMLVGNTTTSSENYLIISKTNANSMALSAYAKASSSRNRYYCFIDLNNDADWVASNNSTQIYSVSATSLAPVAFSSGNYCEHAFFTPFTQFTEPCIIQLNGKKYAYDGYLELEE